MLNTLKGILVAIIFFLNKKLAPEKINIGIRSFLPTNKKERFKVSFLDTFFLKEFCFDGDVKKLINISKKLKRKLVVCGWFRDEYGSSDGAGYEPVGIEISSNSIREELSKILNEKLPGFYVGPAVRAGKFF